MIECCRSNICCPSFWLFLFILLWYCGYCQKGIPRLFCKETTLCNFSLSGISSSLIIYSASDKLSIPFGSIWSKGKKKYTGRFRLRFRIYWLVSQSLSDARHWEQQFHWYRIPQGITTNKGQWYIKGFYHNTEIATEYLGKAIMFLSKCPCNDARTPKQPILIQLKYSLERKDTFYWKM